MAKIGKKAGLFKIIGFVFFVIAIVLLVFLIRNDWNVGFAINEFIELIGKLKEQIGS
jgi:hypothetical protein